MKRVKDSRSIRSQCAKPKKCSSFPDLISSNLEILSSIYLICVVRNSVKNLKAKN